MKRHATLPILSCLAILLTASSTYADEGLRQVWVDSDKQIVHNTWGTCVRSRWDNATDPCAPPPVFAYQAPPPPPPPRTIIADADRTVFFPFNRSELTPDSQQKLDQLSQRINNASDIQDAQVVGFADRIGTTSYNEALSKKRAETVRDYLIAHNVITERDTMTRWVGKSQSDTQCPPNLTHDQMIQCLSPDRKVTVNLKYKVVEQPQINAAPPMLPPGQVMGQPPLAPTAAAHVLTPENSNAVVPPAPYPMDRDTNNANVRVYPLEQTSAQPVQVMPLSPQSSADQAVPVAPAATPMQQSSIAQPVPAPQALPPAPAPHRGIPIDPELESNGDPSSQPTSSNPSTYSMNDLPVGGGYAQTAYRDEYAPSENPVVQPSNAYRERYLTTGE